MKKIVLLATAALLLLAGTAMAESIAGKVGITARGGASYILNSEFTDEAMINLGMDQDIKRGIGWNAGGGIICGITDNLAVNFDILYSRADLKFSNSTYSDETFGKGSSIDFAFGAQWRFMPTSQFVPYVEAGVDVLMNKISLDDEYSSPGESWDAAVSFGGHLSAGVDFFITPNIALNAEIRGLLANNADVTRMCPGDPDVVVAKYNPSNISGFLGIRFFFP